MNNKSLTLGSSQSCLVVLTCPIFREGLNQEIIARPIRSTVGLFLGILFIKAQEMIIMRLRSALVRSISEWSEGLAKCPQEILENTDLIRSIPLTFGEFEGLTLV